MDKDPINTKSLKRQFLLIYKSFYYGKDMSHAFDFLTCVVNTPALSLIIEVCIGPSYLHPATRVVIAYEVLIEINA